MYLRRSILGPGVLCVVLFACLCNVLVWRLSFLSLSNPFSLPSSIPPRRRMKTQDYNCFGVGCSVVLEMPA